MISGQNNPVEPVCVDAQDRAPSFDPWQAIRRGDIYCAPRCGRGCTWAAYENACADADTLANRLGPGWTPYVHENLGWFYGAKMGCAHVSGSYLKRFDDAANQFTAFVNAAKQFVVTADTPEDAYGFAIQEARTFIARLGAELAELALIGDGAERVHSQANSSSGSDQ